jgi:hypothetical protein
LWLGELTVLLRITRLKAKLKGVAAGHRGLLLLLLLDLETLYYWLITANTCPVQGGAEEKICLGRTFVSVLGFSSSAQRPAPIHK